MEIEEKGEESVSGKAVDDIKREADFGEEIKHGVGLEAVAAEVDQGEDGQGQGVSAHEPHGPVAAGYGIGAAIKEAEQKHDDEEKVFYRPAGLEEIIKTDADEHKDQVR